MVPLEDADIDGNAFKAHAHAFYARLRAERPVCRVRGPNREELHLVARYEDVSALLRDPRLAKDPANALSAEQMRNLRKPPKRFAPLTRNMLGLDDPDHARLKRLVQAAFNSRRVEMLRARTETVGTALLDKVSPNEPFDLIAGYALPLPVTVISDLLGVPRRDQARFARWSHTLINNRMTPLSMILSLPHMLAFMRYLKRLIDMKRMAPDDDLVSDLIVAKDEGGSLDAEELMAMIAILLSAGHETTTNLLGNGILALLQNPEEYARLRSNRELLGQAVEELLRFSGPVEMSTPRYAREALEIGGHVIPRGATLVGSLASANRDERKFPDAGRLDLSRERNRHLTFGEGGHYCVGASLARMEGCVAFNQLLERFPRLRLEDPLAGPSWRSGFVLRGLETLFVTNAA